MAHNKTHHDTNNILHHKTHYDTNILWHTTKHITTLTTSYVTTKHITTLTTSYGTTKHITTLTTSYGTTKHTTISTKALTRLYRLCVLTISFLYINFNITDPPTPLLQKYSFSCNLIHEV